MDITYFFEDNDTKEVNEYNDIQVLLHKAIEENKLELLEYTYITDFLSQRGNLININWLKSILKKINNRELTNLFEDKFRKLIKDDVINDLIEKKKDIIKFTDDQKAGITQIIKFMTNLEQKTYGLYGYAGTGKTTTLVELMSYFLENEYIKSIAFTAPTNKAVNVMKNKFKPYLESIYKKLVKKEITADQTIDDMIGDISEKKVRIDFITIHKLLNYKNDFDSEGDRIFLKGKDTNIRQYDIVIIDECSMIPLQIIVHLMEDIRDGMSVLGKNLIKIPKLLFSGDPAQLPPVNESSSSLFLKYDLTYDDFIKHMPESESKSKKSDGLDQYKLNQNRIKILKDDLMKIETYTIKDVVRNKIDNIVNLCLDMRKWIDGGKELPDIRKHLGNGLYAYKKTRDKKRIETKWFQKFIEKIKENNSMANVILTWTNKQTDEYNQEIRKIMFNEKRVLERFEVGDILMLTDFYSIGSADDQTRLYTSDQIKIVEITKNKLASEKFVDSQRGYIERMKKVSLKDYENLINLLNSKKHDNYYIWKLGVTKMNTAKISDLSDKFYINVIHSKSEDKLMKDKKKIFGKICKYRDEMYDKYPDNKKVIEKYVINNLWKQYNKIMIDPFAKVDYSFSITTHKSQGSTYYNVWIDLDDMLDNGRIEEAKRCIYTAVTRSSNELHILV